MATKQSTAAGPGSLIGELYMGDLHQSRARSKVLHHWV